jgi:hypothetical protein
VSYFDYRGNFILSGEKNKKKFKDENFYESGEYIHCIILNLVNWTINYDTQGIISNYQGTIV